MSIVCNVNNLSLEERTNVVKNLQFNKKVNPRYKNQSISPTIYPYNIIEDDIYLPFFGVKKMLNVPKDPYVLILVLLIFLNLKAH